MVMQHFAHIKRRNYRNHQRQAFRYCHNNNNNRQDYSLHQIGNYCCHVSKVRCKAACQIYLMQHYRNCYQHTAGITEFTYLLCQSLQLQLQRTVTFIILQLLRQPAINGIIAYLHSLHHRSTFYHNAATEQLMFIKKVNFPVIPLKVSRCSSFFSFLAFTVQCCLVQLQRSFQQNAVCRYFITSLQNNCLTYYNIINSNFLRLAVTPHLAADAARFLLQLLKGVLIAVFRPCGNKGCQNDRQKNTYCFNPISMTKINKKGIYQERYYQYADNRILKIPQQFAPKGFPRRLRQRVITVLAPRLFNLLFA